MKQPAFLSLLLLVCTGPAYADVTVRMTTTGPAMTPASPGGGRGAVTTVEMPATYFIKGTRARIDQKMGGRERTTIVDFAAGKMIALDPETREATIIDLARLGEQARQTVRMDATTVSMKPTGRTREIQGLSCTEFELSVTVPMNPPNGREANTGPVTMTQSGPVWIARDAPGTKDVEAFYRAAASSGLFLASAGRGGGAAMGMAAMYKALADAGGIPYEQHLRITIGGTGPTADRIRSMSPTQETVTAVTGISTDPIPDERFLIPAGYTRRTQ